MKLIEPALGLSDFIVVQPVSSADFHLAALTPAAFKMASSVTDPITFRPPSLDIVDDVVLGKVGERKGKPEIETKVETGKELR